MTSTYLDKIHFSVEHDKQFIDILNDIYIYYSLVEIMLTNKTMNTH